MYWQTPLGLWVSSLWNGVPVKEFPKCSYKTLQRQMICVILTFCYVLELWYVHNQIYSNAIGKVVFIHSMVVLVPLYINRSWKLCGIIFRWKNYLKNHINICWYYLPHINRKNASNVETNWVCRVTLRITLWRINSTSSNIICQGYIKNENARIVESYWLWRVTSRITLYE